MKNFPFSGLADGHGNRGDHLFFFLIYLFYLEANYFTIL